MGYHITDNDVNQYRQHLREEGRTDRTIDKYLHDIRSFREWLQERDVTKERLVEWREYLEDQGYAAVSINAKLSPLNGLFKFLDQPDLHIKFLHIQRKVFRDSARDLTKAEYRKLLKTAYKLGKKRTALVMETICGTGIRVSELQYITVEAVRQGYSAVSLKGKIRFIIIPQKLSEKLLEYAQEKSIDSGEIFQTRTGKILSRRQIWSDMKYVSIVAGVEPSKVFPHNLRHLFATEFYRECKDIVKLADVLGHSSIDTTRIYLISTGIEHAKYIEKLGLIT